MTDVVRTVAMAICKSRTCEGISCCQWPANMGRNQCNAKQGAYDDAARDAIMALMPATPEMLDAALEMSGARVEPHTAERESGVPMECDISEEDAAEINEMMNKESNNRSCAMLGAALKQGRP